MNRRTALKQMGTVAAAAVVAHAVPAAAIPAAPFTLPALPYGYEALEPYFDAETMHLHHDKHHQAYVNNLNAVINLHPDLAGRAVEDLARNWHTLPESIQPAVRNNAGGHANHSLLWQTLGKGSSAPAGELARAIDLRFGSFSALEAQWTKAALSVFGSGWAWLAVAADGSLNLETTPNQDLPSGRPLAGIDVWEHAYYLKYQNRRADYVTAFFKVANWDHMSANFAQITDKKGK